MQKSVLSTGMVLWSKEPLVPYVHGTQPRSRRATTGMRESALPYCPPLQRAHPDGSCDLGAYVFRFCPALVYWVLFSIFLEPLLFVFTAHFLTIYSDSSTELPFTMRP